MEDWILNIAKEHGIHFLIELALVGLLWACHKRSSQIAEEFDERLNDCHRLRLEEMTQALKLATKAKKVINGGSHEQQPEEEA